MAEETNTQQEIKHPCISCGAELQFEPGTTSLKCPYCGTENTFEEEETIVEESDFLSVLEQLENNTETVSVKTVKCENCGAESTFDENTVSDECGFCGSHITIENSEEHKVLKPQYLLPFKLKSKEAYTSIKSWVKGLFWAPGKMKKYFNNVDKLQGIYLPYFTYDSDTTTPYTGQRGEYYYETEYYTTTDDKGNSVQKSRQVRKTRWYPASGTVYQTFDDVLVEASTSMPEKYLERLEPWDLENLTSYDAKYLAGFKAESYQKDIKTCFGEAKDYMVDEISDSVRRDIGGDTQMISSMHPKFDDITYKYILLPSWITSYIYKNKVYRVVVNARTGEVQGEYPFDWVKLVGIILGVATLGGGLYYYFNYMQ